MQRIHRRESIPFCLSDGEINNPVQITGPFDCRIPEELAEKRLLKWIGMEGRLGVDLKTDERARQNTTVWIVQQF